MGNINKNYKKFIILVAVFILIIVGVIILINMAFKGFKDKENDDIKANLLTVQAKAKVIEGNVKSKVLDAKYLGQKFVTLEDQNLKDKIKATNISEMELVYYYVLSKQDMATMGLENLFGDNEVMVNYLSGEVVFINGVKKNKTVVYKLSEL